MSFEPFFDYEAISQEMAEDLSETLRQLREAQEDLLSAQDAEGQVACAKRVVEVQNEIMFIHREINRHIYTVPAMVHVAGEPKLEFERGRPVYVQRCERCGSDLCHSYNHESSEDFDNEHFAVGERIGKAEVEGAETMYFIGERDLREHELQCVSFKEIFGIDS